MLAWSCLMWIWLSVNHFLRKSDKPNCVGLTEFYCILGYGWSMLVFLILWGKSCPNWGWQCCWEIKENTSLWLGGTLQRHSWLRDKLISKISIILYFILCNCNCIMNYYEHDECLNGWFCFRCILHYASIYTYECFKFDAFLYILCSWGLDCPGW